MNHDAAAIIKSELDSGERLIWAGIPKQGVVLRGSDALMIPFSVMWGGFAIFWEVMALAIPEKGPGGTAVVFPLFGIPFVVIGLYMIVGRFIYDSKARAKTFYGLTDERVVIVSGLLRKQVVSLSLKTLADISISEKNDGSGTITFGRDNQFPFSFGAGFPTRGAVNVPKFDLIGNAKEVYKQLRAQQKLV